MKTDKNELRKKAKYIRQSLNMELISEKIRDRVFDLPEYKSARNLFTYHSFGDEVLTVDFLSDNNKNWFIPRIQSDELLVCEYDTEHLFENCFGIVESSKDVIPDVLGLDTIILPALMGDKSGNRLGYGKGYYDRFLSSLQHSPCKLLLLPEELLVDELPIEDHDCKCDIIITQHNTYRI